MENKELKLISNSVRLDIINSIYNAQSGHPGSSLSVVEVLVYLYFNFMKIDNENPKLEIRDRLILSKGHAAPALYSVLARRGFFDKSEIMTLRKLGSRLQGHPDMNKVPGVDMSTGSLGQGLSAAVGMAIGIKMKKQNSKVFCICGDGEMQEGQIWEAIMYASFKKLDNLILIIDNNNLQIDGKIENICSYYPIKEKFEAFNFNTFEMDGHNFLSIDNTFKKLATLKNNKPTVIISKTIKGKGISFMENVASWHGKAPNEEQYNIAINELKKERKILC